MLMLSPEQVREAYCCVLSSELAGRLSLGSSFARS